MPTLNAARTARVGKSRKFEMASSLFDKSSTQKIKPADGMANMLMSMLARSHNGVLSITPGIAGRILGELNFPEQRKVDTTRVYGHGDNIRRGDWMEGHPITFAALPSGAIWLVDGQHRLIAISKQDHAVPVTVRVVPVESEKEARHFYAGFDQKKSVRTDKQILDAVGIAESTGLNSRMVNAVFRAAPLLLNNLEPLTGSVNISRNPAMFLQQNKLEIVCGWAGEAREYEEITKKAKSGLMVAMRTTGILAVALYTLRHQPARAKEFWTGVALNDGLRRNDPRATLIGDLLVRTMSTGSIRQKVQQPALAWNAFCEGRDLKIIKCIDGSAITLWGTPLAKGRQA